MGRLNRRHTACHEPQEAGAMFRTFADRANAADAQAEPHVKVRLACQLGCRAAYVPVLAGCICEGMQELLTITAARRLGH